MKPVFFLNTVPDFIYGNYSLNLKVIINITKELIQERHV